MLDGTNVIDYVQFAGPNSLRDLNAELTSPDQLDPNGLWQTNLLGVFNQLNLSKGSLSPNQVPPEDGGQWSTTAGSRYYLHPTNAGLLSGVVYAEQYRYVL